MFRHFQALSPAFHDGYTSGRVISRQTSDVDAIYEMLETGFDGLVTAALTLVGTAVLLLFLDVKLGPGRAALRTVPGLADPLVPQGVRQDLPRHPREGRAGHRALRRVDGRHPRGAGVPPRAAQPGDLRRRQRPVPPANLVAFRLVAWFMPGIRLIGNITIAVVLLYGGYLAYHGEVTVGVLAAFLLYLRQFFEPMMEISQFYNTFQSASAALEKLVRGARGGAVGPRADEPRSRSPTRGELRFDHVGFEYVEGGRCCPTSTSTVPAGQTLALVGTTGAGKTTLAKLATRFYDPTAGRVTARRHRPARPRPTPTCATPS